MRALLAVGVAVAFAGAADPPMPTGSVTAADAAKGWIDLFDGETTFGWQAPPGVTLVVKNGTLTVPAGAVARFLLPFPAVVFDIETTGPDGLGLMATAGDATNNVRLSGAATRYAGRVTVGGGNLVVRFDPKPVTGDRPELTTNNATGPVTLAVVGPSALRRFRVKPLDAKPIFDGKTLAGWTPYTGDAKRERSRFSVTPAGELQVKNGPGDLRTDAAYDDFLLQFQCKTNGVALNSGVFFRCIPGEYQNGYEAQIQNAFKDNDRAKPADFGTGAIYRRVPARKVVSNDNEYFTFTVLAAGPRIATWVDGYPTVNWLDDRKADDNPRKGLRTKAGHLSIQGHDPTTDIVFKDIRVASLK